MALASKIATCCYCGTRAALVLKGDSRHELACSTCGAPLHNLKQMPRLAQGSDDVHFSHPIRTPKSKGNSAEKSAKPPRKAKKHWVSEDRRGHKKVKQKRGKRAKRWLEDVFDVIEDIFD